MAGGAYRLKVEIDRVTIKLPKRGITRASTNVFAILKYKSHKKTGGAKKLSGSNSEWHETFWFDLEADAQSECIWIDIYQEAKHIGSCQLLLQDAFSREGRPYRGAFQVTAEDVSAKKSADKNYRGELIVLLTITRSSEAGQDYGSINGGLPPGGPGLPQQGFPQFQNFTRENLQSFPMEQCFPHHYHGLETPLDESNPHMATAPPFPTESQVPQVPLQHTMSNQLLHRSPTSTAYVASGQASHEVQQLDPGHARFNSSPNVTAMSSYQEHSNSGPDLGEYFRAFC